MVTLQFPKRCPLPVQILPSDRGHPETLAVGSAFLSNLTQDRLLLFLRNRNLIKANERRWNMLKQGILMPSNLPGLALCPWFEASEEQAKSAARGIRWMRSVAAW
jgi:hypothetical protein